MPTQTNKLRYNLMHDADPTPHGVDASYTQLGCIRLLFPFHTFAYLCVITSCLLNG